MFICCPCCEFAWRFASMTSAFVKIIVDTTVHPFSWWLPRPSHCCLWVPNMFVVLFSAFFRHQQNIQAEGAREGKTTIWMGSFCGTLMTFVPLAFICLAEGDDDSVRIVNSSHSFFIIRVDFNLQYYCLHLHVLVALPNENIKESHIFYVIWISNVSCSFPVFLT